SSGRTESDLRLYDSLSGEDLSDRARRYPLWTAGRSGAGGATPGREHGGEVSSVRPERGGVSGSTENVLTPETGKRAKVVHNWMKDFHLRKSPPLGVILPGATRGGSPTFFGG